MLQPNDEVNGRGGTFGGRGGGGGGGRGGDGGGDFEDVEMAGHELCKMADGIGSR